MDLINQYSMLHTAVENAGWNTLLGQDLADLSNRVLNKEININDDVFINTLQEVHECYTDYNSDQKDMDCNYCPLNKLCQYEG